MSHGGPAKAMKVQEQLAHSDNTPTEMINDTNRT